MPNIKEFIKKIGSESVSLEEQQQALVEIEQTIKAARQKREEEVGKNAKMVVDALKQIESRLNDKFQELLATPAMVGAPGRDGKDGKDGKDGLPGPAGINGAQGKDGIDGVDGKDGVSVVDAKIDFDGSLVITLSNGDEIDAGLVVPTAVAEQYNAFMTRGDIIPTQSGNSGKYLTTDGSNLAWDQINISTADITGTLPIANGGTGATTAPNARTNLGLGTIATQNANSVAVTGGSIDGTTIGGSTPAAGTFTTLTATGQTKLGGDTTNPGLEVPALAGITRWLRIAGSTSTGVDLSIQGTGNSNLTYTSRGTGGHYFTTNTSATNYQLFVSNTTSAVNYVQVTGAATGGTPVISAQGSDSNVTLQLQSKGTAAVVLATNGVNQFDVFGLSTAVNRIRASGAVASSGPALSSTGSDTNIDLNLTTKGTGAVRFNTGGGEQVRIIDVASADTPWFITGGRAGVQGNRITGLSPSFQSTDSASIGFRTNAGTSGGLGTDQLRVAHTASAVNYVQVTGNVTTSRPIISAQGSDTNIGLTISSKGNRSIALTTNSVTALDVLSPASGVNFLTLNGSITNLSPSIVSTGTDTNIDLTLTPKGTGLVQFGTHTATALTISGYVEIKDSGGTIRKLAVVT